MFGQSFVFYEVSSKTPDGLFFNGIHMKRSTRRRTQVYAIYLVRKLDFFFIFYSFINRRLYKKVRYFKNLSL